MQQVRPVILLDIDDTLFDTANFKQSGLSEYKVYEEVEKTLSDLSIIATLAIFSKGEDQFQKTKLEKTGLLKFFDDKNVYIFDDKNINLLGVIGKYKDSKIFLVDDILEVLHSAKKNAEQVVTIWVKRGRYAHSQKEIPGFTPDATITSLNEVVGLILNT